MGGQAMGRGIAARCPRAAGRGVLHCGRIKRASAPGTQRLTRKETYIAPPINCGCGAGRGEHTRNRRRRPQPHPAEPLQAPRPRRRATCIAQGPPWTLVFPPKVYDRKRPVQIPPDFFPITARPWGSARAFRPLPRWPRRAVRRRRPRPPAPASVGRGHRSPARGHH